MSSFFALWGIRLSEQHRPSVQSETSNADGTPLQCPLPKLLRHVN